MKKIALLLLVALLVGCTQRISNVTKIEMYSIDDSSTPATIVLENSSIDKDTIKIFVNLINNAKLMDIKLSSSIFKKYLALNPESNGRKIYFVIYEKSFDGYFHFENDEKYYQFRSTDLADLINSGIKY